MCFHCPILMYEARRCLPSSVLPVMPPSGISSFNVRHVGSIKFVLHTAGRFSMVTTSAKASTERDSSGVGLREWLTEWASTMPSP